MENEKLMITLEDFRKILGAEWDIFQKKILHNCLCHTCDSAYDSTIVGYTVEINDLDDVILLGKCAKCSNPITRYVETGENEEQVKVIEEIRMRYAKN